MAPKEDDRFHPKDAISATIEGTVASGVCGLLVSGVQNTLTRSSVGPWGVFTRTGGTVAAFAAMGGSYEFTRIASANLRQKEDSWNHGIGGFVAGSILGLKWGRTPVVLGFGALTAVIMGAYDYTGGSLRGPKKDLEVDEFERKEALRRNRRRPIEDTISEIGEGRGIYGPGYRERRAETIKAKYGIEIPTS